MPGCKVARPVYNSAIKDPLHLEKSMTTLQAFLHQLLEAPEKIQFNDTMAVIDAHYDFVPTAFQNGDQFNAAGENSGSCKLFSFAQLHQLSPAQTLQCFGAYYREDVLNNPNGIDHQNIRNFMRTGWDGIRFEGQALIPRSRTGEP
jgi:hypothetical protein